MAAGAVVYEANAEEEVAVTGTAVRDTRGPYIQIHSCTSFEATGPLTPLSQSDYGRPRISDPSGVRSVTNDAPSAGFPVGRTNITWTATDTLGYTFSRATCVYVFDTTPPSITPPGPHLSEATGSLTLMNSTHYGVATATDLVTASAAITITNDAPESFPVGDTTVNWTATDGSGNSSSAEQRITVVDTTPPTLTVPGARVIEAKGSTTALTALDHGDASATDLVDSSPTVTNNLVDALALGISRILWTATDSDDNVRATTMVGNISYYDTVSTPPPQPETTPPPQPETTPPPQPETTPPPQPIEFTIGGLDGASVRIGESRTFDVNVTRVEGGGVAIILLSGQPSFVTVQNIDNNKASITVDATHSSAVVGSHTFTIMAATGSDPATKLVTITITS